MGSARSLERVTTTISWPFAPDATFVEQLDGLYVPWEPDPAPAPRLLALNEDVALELGLDPAMLADPDGVAVPPSLTLTSPDAQINGAFGTSISGVPDADGDGHGDVLVGAEHEPPQGLVEILDTRLALVQRLGRIVEHERE